jgi:predicted NBD/HSP70 family sugar kinase
MTYVLFDIGGTKTRVAISSDLETLSASTSFKTPISFSEGIKKLITTAESLAKKEKITAFAGGIRGPLTEDKSGIENDSVLTKWVGKSLIAEIQKVHKVPVFLENDAALAGLGEAVFGAGKGADIVAYHTISTGVGGAKIENQEIDEAAVGFEPGHQIIDVDRTVMGDDIQPTLENVVSGTAIKNRFGVEPYEIPQSDVLWEELAEYLAQGLCNTIMYWSPEVIVLGGSMILGDPKIEIDAIRKYTVEALNDFQSSPLITLSKLGDEAGLYGAMTILKNRGK